MQFFKQYLQQFFDNADEELKGKALQVLTKFGIILDPENGIGDVELDGMGTEVKKIINKLDKLETSHLSENLSHIKTFKNF